MARAKSQFLTDFFANRETLEARNYNSHIALEITLSNASKLYYATGEITIDSVVDKDGNSVAQTPQAFDDKITNTGDILFSQKNTSDGSTPFSVDNLDYLFSALIPDASRLFDGARVKIFLAFPKPSGNYEAVVYAEGNLSQSDGDDETAEIAFVSDLQDRSQMAGGAEVTQKCLNTFGVDSGASWCGANNLPANAECNLIYDDAEPETLPSGGTRSGCAYWGAQHSFKGIKGYNPNDVAGYTGDYPTRGGWDVDGGGRTRCPDEFSFFKTADGLWVRGDRLVEGETVLLDAQGRASTIEQLERVFCEYRYKIASSCGRAWLVCSAAHPVQTVFGEDASCEKIIDLLPDTSETSTFFQIWKKQTTLGINQAGGGGVAVSTDLPRVSLVAEIGGKAEQVFFGFRPAVSGYVLRISLAGETKMYLVGGAARAGFNSHNKPPMYEIPTQY